MGGSKGALIGFIGVALISIMIGYFVIKPEESLPIYQPSDINPALVDEEVRNRQDHRISDFSLINQLGDTISKKDVEGKILIVDFFFARCQTICPVMNKNMAKVQNYFSDSEDILLLSHSVTPQIDSVSVLYDYAKEFGADSTKWWLMTGAKSDIYSLARKSYFAVLDEGDGGLQDFIHTENVVLVDPYGRLRGYYDGTSEEEMGKLVNDIALLRSELAEGEKER